MTSPGTGRRKMNATPQPRYKTVALPPSTYAKVLVWADHLRDTTGRCTIAQAIEYLADNAGVPKEKE